MRGALKPGCGWLPDAWMPEDLLRKDLRGLARRTGSPAITSYSSTLGSAPLRRLIARRMNDQGVEAGPDQILRTDSGTQAIDLVCRFLIEPGDAVLIDDPCYFNFPGAAARAPGQADRRAATRRTGPMSPRSPSRARDAPAAPLHHQQRVP